MGNSIHAKLAPSSADKWLGAGCTGYMKLVSIVNRDDSQAIKGTKLHEQAEAYLNNKNFQIDDEIKAYCDYIFFLQRELKVNKHVEEKLTITEQCYGTADIIFESDDHLIVVDLKTGMLRVEPDSLQLKIYALGAYLKYYNESKNFTSVKTVIYQFGRADVYEYTFLELEALKDQIISISEKVDNECFTFSASSKGCRYCEHLIVCKAGQSFVKNQGLKLKQITDIPDGVINIDDQIDIAKSVNNLSKQLLSDAKNLLIDNHITSNKYYLKERQGRQVWTDEKLVIEYLKEMATADEYNTIVKETIPTPTQLKKKGIDIPHLTKRIKSSFLLEENV